MSEKFESKEIIEEEQENVPEEPQDFAEKTAEQAIVDATVAEAKLEEAYLKITSLENALFEMNQKVIDLQSAIAKLVEGGAIINESENSEISEEDEDSLPPDFAEMNLL